MVKELRIILTVPNLDEMVRFYKDVAGMHTSKEWHEETGNGIILEAGKASLELIDEKHATLIDQIEAGSRTSGPVRLALNAGENLLQLRQALLENGAQSVAEVRKAPWSEVVRLQAPDGMQLTLFSTSTLFPDE